MLAIMLNANILTITEINNFNTLGINNISGFFNWINGLPASQKTSALTVFTDFISNPYWGMPLSGPSNPTGCQLVVYKPNNYQFAKQGAVSSSTRNLKLNVDTISTNAASINNYNNTGPQLVNANQLYFNFRIKNCAIIKDYLNIKSLLLNQVHIVISQVQ